MAYVIIPIESEVKRLAPNEKGIGRPFVGDEPKDVKLQVRMSKSEIDDLDGMASELQTTRSGVIRKGLELVRKWLSEKK